MRTINHPSCGVKVSDYNLVRQCQSKLAAQPEHYSDAALMSREEVEAYNAEEDKNGA